MSGAEGLPRLGFAGLGLMGEPMARNLVRAGTPLTVWNRSPERAAALGAAGATVAPDVAALFAASDVVILMLVDAAAIDAVLGRGGTGLGRGGAGFADLVAGRTVVTMGTTSPAYSAGLAADVRAAGGRYVEAPVSGSAGPAGSGDLVAMLAGDEADLDVLEPLLKPMCRQTVRAGAVPNALLTKLAVNVYLVTTVAALAESVHFAQRHGLDPDVFRAVLDAGPMASRVSRDKLAAMLDAQFSPNAAIRDVLANCDLIVAAAGTAGLDSPLLTAARALYARTAALGHGDLDMAAVLTALRAPA
jgi:3-hydroxyisobutyrate dehydrogenase